MLGTIHGTEDTAVRLRVPSPVLAASTGVALPLAPCATRTGPTVVVRSRSFGAAESVAEAARSKNAIDEKDVFKPTLLLLVCLIEVKQLAAGDDERRSSSADSMQLEYHSHNCRISDGERHKTD
jgi:hypothetical protein